MMMRKRLSRLLHKLLPSPLLYSSPLPKVLPRLLAPRLPAPRLLALLVFANLTLTACATTESDAPQTKAEDLEKGWEIIRITNVAGSISTNSGSFKTKVFVYLHKPMKSFFCQPYSPKREIAGRKGAEKKFEQIPLGEKVYLKNNELAIGAHSLTLRVRVVSKYTSERRIKWLYYCDGEIDSHT